jgi:Uma2 family endonuclease
MSSFDVTHADSELPPIDERLVEPETRYEMLDGELMYVAPSDPPHGNRQAKIAALVEAHVAQGFEVATELLTRTSKIDDFAPDVSVYPMDLDSRTGRRQIDELSFEVVSTQRMSLAEVKAAKLTARGVRRVFAIDVEHERALEWLPAQESWRVLDIRSYIEDPSLAVALPVAALVSEASADNDVARALVIKRNPVFEEVRESDRAEGRSEGRAEGRAEGLAEGHAEGLAEGLLRGQANAILTMARARGLAIEPAESVRVLAERDPARLERWLIRAATCASIRELLDE